tara:strand:- start:1267 stop:1437 length:171 start_codon:yes stop_codon:yes gene_type:complete
MREQDPAIKLRTEIKEKLENLDFVRKHTHSQIIENLIEFYEEYKGVFEKWMKEKKK